MITNIELAKYHPVKRPLILKKEFVSYCKNVKGMRAFNHVTKTHNQLTISAIEFLDEKGRDPALHFTEEFNEVVEAVEGDNPVNVLEEIGDLLFTAVRLARAKGHDINMSDVIWANQHKLSLRKDM